MLSQSFLSPQKDISSILIYKPYYLSGSKTLFTKHYSSAIDTYQTSYMLGIYLLVIQTTIHYMTEYYGLVIALYRR